MNFRFFLLIFLTFTVILEPAAEARRARHSRTTKSEKSGEKRREPRRRHRGERHRARHREVRGDQGYTNEICPSGGRARSIRTTVYYTPVLSPVKCQDGQLGLMNWSKKEMPDGLQRNSDPCSESTKTYVVKRMEGAGAILSISGQYAGMLVNPKGPIDEIRLTGVTASETLPNGSPQGMYYVSEPQCPAGYGSHTLGDPTGEPVCLDPFRMIACPKHHPIGEVAFIPSAVGIPYPRYPGQSKNEYQNLPGSDGYFVCGDIGDMIRGEHIDLFSGFLNPSFPGNPYEKFGDGNHGVCWVPAERDDPERRYKYHSPRDWNPNFPYLDPWTVAYYTNNYLLAQAFRIPVPSLWPWSVRFPSDK